eukprot:9000617-Lingulodinium_polyedra.AAC.1
MDQDARKPMIGAVRVIGSASPGRRQLMRSEQSKKNNTTKKAEPRRNFELQSAGRRQWKPEAW